MEPAPQEKKSWRRQPDLNSTNAETDQTNNGKGRSKWRHRKPKPVFQKEIIFD
jgi:hypothetical protein